MSSDDSNVNRAGLLNYEWFHYTLLDGLWPLSISLLLGWLGFLFYLMASITNGFFVPGVNKMSQLLGVSNKLAGVAFLAGCNGLPHVIAGGTAIVFSSPSLGIGSLVGGGLIDTTLVWAFILMAAPFLSTRELAIYRRPFFRDLSFVVVALLGVYLILFFEHVKWWMPVVFLACYFVYLLVVFVGRCIYQRFNRKQREALGIVEDAEELQELAVLEENEEYPNLDELMFIHRTRSHSAKKKNSKKQSSSSSPLSSTTASSPRIKTPSAYSILDSDDSEDDRATPSSDQFDPFNLQSTSRSSSSSSSYSSNSSSSSSAAASLSSSSSGSSQIPSPPSDDEENDLLGLAKNPPFGRADEQENTEDDEDDDEDFFGEGFRRKSMHELTRNKAAAGGSYHNTYCTRLTNYLAVSTRWHELSMPQRVWFVLSMPVILIRNATIPIVGEEEWIFFWALINPLAAPLVVLLATHQFPTASIADVFPVWALLLCIGFVLSVIVFFTASTSRPPRYYFLYVIACLLMCLVWMYLVSCEIVDLIRLLGSVFDVSDSGMGLTIMSWGIAAGDVYNSLALTNQGYRNMALSASLSSPTFTLLIGIGVSLLIKVASEGGSYLVKLDPLLELGFGSFGTILLVLSVGVPIMKFKPTQLFSWFQVIFYITFLIFVILFELKVLP